MPSIEQCTVSPRCTNFVATMLPVMTTISRKSLWPRFASTLASHEGVKRMAHDIAAILLTNDDIVDHHRAMYRRQITSLPVCGWRTENNNAIPGVVSNNGEDLGRELRIIGVPIIDQLEGCHHGANGLSDMVATIETA